LTPDEFIGPRPGGPGGQGGPRGQGGHRPDGQSGPNDRPQKPPGE
jgi:hypothetical protein